MKKSRCRTNLRIRARGGFPLARVTADVLDALGRAEEAKALRERYGVTPPENPPSS